LVSPTWCLDLSFAISHVLVEGPLLLKNLREAHEMTKRCEDICQEFEKHRPPGTIHEWKMIKRRWELDSSQPDPYVVVEKGKATAHTIPSLSY
jgi:hypothetical protein